MGELRAVTEDPAITTSAEILLVDDDPKTLLAMEATLSELGASMVTARSGREALMKLLHADFALILLDVQMPDMDGFETAELIRSRDKTRHTPIMFLTAFNQNDRSLLRGYGIGAVDFMFKPIVPDILRSKVQVFVELHRKTQEVRRQAQLIRESEARDHLRRMADERQRWEANALREQMETERAAAEQMARKAEELAIAVADRDAAAMALVQSNSRLALLSDTANRLLVGDRPHAILTELFQRLTGHLDLDVYSYRRLVDDQLILELSGGVAPELAEQSRSVRMGQSLPGKAAAERRRIVYDEVNGPTSEAPPEVLRLGATACACFPLLAAHNEVLGTLSFGSRRRQRFTGDELATLQMVVDQIAIALERERLVTELQSRNAELADADRRKDEFLAMLAHELRNPLAPIVNALHVLNHEADGDPAIVRAHRTMDRQVRHLIRLIDDLLDVSRITQGKIELRREPTHLQTVIDQAVTIARPLINSRGHQLIVTVPDEPVPVDVDVTRMAQVVSNLLNNAAKYSERPGTITLSAERGEDEVVIRVKDTGIGIRAEMLPRVFELFVQADSDIDRAAGGLGIGLTLVKRLVQMHGGEVMAQSEGEGKGSEFIVTVPLADDDETAAAVEAVAVAARAVKQVAAATGGARHLRILVVEDNADIRETLKELLEIEGHIVTLAEDGQAAVAEAGNGHEHDVALVDIGLPGIDGYAVAQRLRDIRAHKGFPRRLIAMTGYGQAEDRRRAFEAGFDAHLVKPVDPETLTRLLAAETNEGDV
ncbi:MAG: Chemotaxis protein methyltransferase CheR [Myxococcales bacterium]|nr:Chemotaxis protein methyltransferase CheR [Myxococcales bacterium]